MKPENSHRKKALKRARATEKELTRLNRILQTLYRCNHALVHAVNEHELFQSVCQILVEVGGLRLAWVGHCEEDAQKTVRPVAWAGYGLEYVENVKISWSEETERGRGPTGIALRTGEPYWVRDIQTDPAFAPWRAAALAGRYASCVALPLIAYGARTGCLNLYAGEPNAFNENTIEQYADLANSLAYGVAALRTQEERRRAEEALRDSEQRLQDVVDNTTAVIFVKDLELRYLLINQEYERRYHVQRGQIRGKSDFDIHPHDIAEAVRANDRQVIKAGAPIQFEECVPSNEGERYYIVSKFLLRERAGKPYAVCGIATDITELKRAEELGAEVAREREMFLEEKTRLAGEIHDSLAQSFTGISMQLGMAKEVMTDRNNELFGYIERANDLARFGLAEAHRSVLSLQSTVVKDSGLIESLKMLAERSNIAGRLRCTFRSNLEDGQSLPVVVRQDILRIAQEAISNALRHAKSTAISVNLRLDPPNLTLKVKDNGCGIITEAEIREGFGFANMRARVKKLEGTLDIRTAPGRGTSFVVRVPLR
jgi:PAS domain S-box-containing protein